MGETRMDGVGYAVARLDAPFCAAGVSGALGLCYFVKRGTVWLEREGGSNRAVELRQGTVVGGSGLTAHWFKSDARAPTQRARPLEHAPLGATSRAATDGRSVELVIGHVPLQSLSLTSMAGGMLVVEPDPASPVCRRIWNALAQIEDELYDARPLGGLDSAVRRLSEIVLLNMARHSVATGARDEAIAMGLDLRIMRATAAAAHGPLAAWTVAKLARIAGMSRTTFADRFHRLTGASPLQTITHMRLRLAASTLSRGDKSIAQVADEAGYGSAAAFIRAFERYYRVTPKQWRNAHRAGANGGAGRRAVSATPAAAIAASATATSATPASANGRPGHG